MESETPPTWWHKEEKKPAGRVPAFRKKQHRMKTEEIHHPASLCLSVIKY